MTQPLIFYKNVVPEKAKGRKRHSILPEIKIGQTSLIVITVMIFLLMSLIYLIQANSTATKGYEIEKEQNRIKKLETQAEKLQLEMAKIRSTKELNQVPEQLNMIPFPEEELKFVSLDQKDPLANKEEE